MAEWSTTYRWGGYNRSDARGLVNHDVRQPGVTQSNPQVDPARTGLNVVMVADGNGGLRDLRAGENGTKTVMDQLDAVLARSKKNTRQHKVMKRNPETGKNEPTGEVVEKEIAIRKDASVIVELVMQIDPDFTGTGDVYDERGQRVWELDEHGEPVRDEEGHKVQQVRTCADMSPEELRETDALLDVMIAEAARQHEHSEMLYVTKHFDETHPHVQMAFVPLTKDGRVNATEVLSGGKSRSKAAAQKTYSAKHDDMRKALRDHGYDATFERVDDGKKHKNLTEHKREKNRERQSEQNEAERQQSHMARVNKKWAEVHAAQDDVKQREADLQLREDNAEQQQADLLPVVAEIEQGHADLKQGRAGLKRDQDALKRDRRRFKQQQDTWRAEELPKVRTQAYADAKAEAGAGFAKLREQAVVELNSQSRRLRAVPPDVQAWLDQTPGARTSLDAFQKRRAVPQPATAIQKELSIFDTFKADVRDDQPDDDRERDR